MAIITGNDNNNILNGFETADTINGKGGDDTLVAKGGDDLIVGGTGKDTIHGGSGNDTMIINAGDAVDGEMYDGGFDNDTLTLSTISSSQMLFVDFTNIGLASIENLSVVGKQQQHAMFSASEIGNGGLSESLHVDGGNHDITISINMNGQTTLDLSKWTFSNWQNGHIAVYCGNDGGTITGSAGSDGIVVNGGAMNLHTGGGEDYITINGATSGDVIDGGAGVDSLWVDFWECDASQATIKSIEKLGFNYSGSSDQTITFAATQFAAGGLSTALSMSHITGGTAILKITMGSVTSFSADAFKFSDGIDGYQVQLVGDASAETMIGSIAADVIRGAGGNDSLVGGAGDDNVFGGAGNDSLTGSAGLDSLTGGGGADHFIYAALGDSGVGDGNRDIITDFSAGSDKIDVSAIDANAGVAGNQTFTLDVGGTFAAGEFRIEVNGGDTILSFNVDGGAADMQIVLQGVTGITANDLIL